MTIPTLGNQSEPSKSGSTTMKIGAMEFARKVAAEFQAMETGYRNTRYAFVANALTSYRKFLKEPGSYEELCAQDNIAPLRQKPDLERTSRLALYFHTNAMNNAERNTAGKYARIVDYLHQERINPAAAADHIRDEGGIDAILQKARGHEEAPKVAEDSAGETLRGDEPDFEDQEGDDNPLPRDSESGFDIDEIFDPEQDLSIRLEDETRERVLGSEIPMNEPFFLECKKTRSVGGGWIKIIGRLVRRPSD